jgi:serine/threonine-protein kinase
MSVDIPNYRIVEKLGVGAQTRVFRARCMRTGQDYTVKIVKIVKPEDAGFIELLKAEYAIGSSIDHRVIRKVYEFRLLRQRLRVRGAILFLEYVNGLPMSDKELRRPMDEILRIFGEVAHGLHAMHLAGWVHADLKPNNILVTPEGAVKIIDLGQSARIHEAKPRVQGTIDYMAPEQVQRGTLDHRTDVFGLGATLHRVLTGRAIATEMNQTVSMHSASLVGRRISEIRESTMDELPTCIARMIEDCCRSEPKDRIPDMPAVVERIDLARTILSKRPAEAEPLVESEDELLAEELQAELAADYDPVAEGLGLTPDEDVVRLDDSTPAG